MFQKYFLSITNTLNNHHWVSCELEDFRKNIFLQEKTLGLHSDGFYVSVKFVSNKIQTKIENMQDVLKNKWLTLVFIKKGSAVHFMGFQFIVGINAL